MVTGSATYPFTPRRLRVGGQEMSYVDEGAGEAVVFVHGNPTWSFYFRELIRALRPAARCLAPDHVGMGLSSRPQAGDYPFTLRRRIDDLDAFIAATVPRGPLSLVVHDWGGMIGMGWAIRNVSRVRSITAMNTACFGLPAGRGLPPGLSFLRGVGGWSLRGSRAARALVLRTCTARRELPAEAKSAYLDVCDGWNESLAVQEFVRDIPLSPADRSWSDVAAIEAGLPALSGVPIYLPWGMRDWVFDETFLNGWRRRFPNATVKRFEDCGHFLLEDAGADAVDSIVDFVAGGAKIR